MFEDASKFLLNLSRYIEMKCKPNSEQCLTLIIHLFYTFNNGNRYLEGEMLTQTQERQ